MKDENEKESDDSNVSHVLWHQVYVEAKRQWVHCSSMSRHRSLAIDLLACDIAIVYSLEHEILARLCHVPPPQTMIDKWTWQHQDSSFFSYWTGIRGSPLLTNNHFVLLGFFFHDSIALLPPFAVFCHAMPSLNLISFLSLAPTRLPCSDVARANHCDWSNDTSPSISIGVTLNPLYFPTEKNTSDSKTARPTQDIRT